MKLLAEISEESLGLEGVEQSEEGFRWRKSARALLQSAEGKIAVQYLQTYGFHKLPGGGVDEGESYEAACAREVREEVGCECEILNSVGYVIEYRHFEKRLQVSQCFVAKVVGEMGYPALEEGEIEEGQVTLWLTPQEALARMKSDVPKKCEGHFILAREQAFLEEFLQRG